MQRTTVTRTLAATVAAGAMLIATPSSSVIVSDTGVLAEATRSVTQLTKQIEHLQGLVRQMERLKDAIGNLGDAQSLNQSLTAIRRANYAVAGSLSAANRITGTEIWSRKDPNALGAKITWNDGPNGNAGGAGEPTGTGGGVGENITWDDETPGDDGAGPTNDPGNDDEGSANGGDVVILKGRIPDDDLRVTASTSPTEARAWLVRNYFMDPAVPYSAVDARDLRSWRTSRLTDAALDAFSAATTAAGVAQALAANTNDIIAHLQASSSIREDMQVLIHVSAAGADNNRAMLEMAAANVRLTAERILATTDPRPDAATHCRLSEAPDC